MKPSGLLIIATAAMLTLANVTSAKETVVRLSDAEMDNVTAGVVPPQIQLSGELARMISVSENGRKIKINGDSWLSGELPFIQFSGKSERVISLSENGRKIEINGNSRASGEFSSLPFANQNDRKTVQPR